MAVGNLKWSTHLYQRYLMIYSCSIKARLRKNAVLSYGIAHPPQSNMHQHWHENIFQGHNSTSQCHLYHYTKILHYDHYNITRYNYFDDHSNSYVTVQTHMHPLSTCLRLIMSLIIKILNTVSKWLVSVLVKCKWDDMLSLLELVNS